MTFPLKCESSVILNFQSLNIFMFHRHYFAFLYKICQKSDNALMAETDVFLL